MRKIFSKHHEIMAVCLALSFVLYFSLTVNALAVSSSTITGIVNYIDNRTDNLGDLEDDVEDLETASEVTDLEDDYLDYNDEVLAKLKSITYRVTGSQFEDIEDATEDYLEAAEDLNEALADDIDSDLEDRAATTIEEAEEDLENIQDELDGVPCTSNSCHDADDEEESTTTTTVTSTVTTSPSTIYTAGRVIIYMGAKVTSISNLEDEAEDVKTSNQLDDFAAKFELSIAQVNDTLDKLTSSLTSANLSLISTRASSVRSAAQGVLYELEDAVPSHLSDEYQDVEGAVEDLLDEMDDVVSALVVTVESPLSYSQVLGVSTTLTSSSNIDDELEDLADYIDDAEDIGDDADDVNTPSKFDDFVDDLKALAQDATEVVDGITINLTNIQLRTLYTAINDFEDAMDDAWEDCYDDCGNVYSSSDWEDAEDEIADELDELDDAYSDLANAYWTTPSH